MLDELNALTSGSTVLYPRFSFDSQAEHLAKDISRLLLQDSYYDCIAKVRCGAGLQTDLAFGHFVKTEAGDLKFSCLNSQQTFAVTFLYDSKLPESEKVCFQCAILYTTPSGQLRIRIHNLALPCTSDISSIFKMADLDAVMNLFVKQGAAHQSCQLLLTLVAACLYNQQPLPFIAGQITAKCTHILAAYRKHCASSMSSGQLVLPDALKLLPLYASCFLKSPGFVTSTTLMI